MVVKGGVYYFKRHETAQRWADIVGAVRVLRFMHGYAVQYHVSGAYVGVIEPLIHQLCPWCPSTFRGSATLDDYEKANK